MHPGQHVAQVALRVVRMHLDRARRASRASPGEGCDESTSTGAGSARERGMWRGMCSQADKSEEDPVHPGSAVGCAHAPRPGVVCCQGPLS